MPKSTLSIAEAAVVSLICFGLFTYWSLQAALGGFPAADFTDAGNALTIIVELLLGITALIFLRARGFDIATLYPRPTLRGAGLGIVLFLATWLAGAIVTAALRTPGRLDVIEFSFRGTSLTSTVALAMVNGTFEEVFLLGVLVRGLRGLGFSVAVGLPLLVRVLYHTYQGPLGVAWVATFGLLLTVAYVSRQDLWPPVFAHVISDIVPTL